MPEHDLAMIEAARTSGVRKVVKLSAIRGGDHATGVSTSPSDWHAPGEQAPASSGPAWSALRPSSFASNAVRWAGAIRAGQPVPNTTGAATQGVVHPEDVTAVAVQVLLTDTYDGATHTLTGPELLSVPDTVACLAEKLGEVIETVDL
jgi:uncharacterized protein YbjT (DUF2867 family)